MKKLLSFLAVSSLATFLSLRLIAQEMPSPPPGEGRPSAGPGGPRGGGGPREETPVGREMEAIQSAFRKLNRQYADAAQKASSLELVASMEKHLDAAKSLTPSKAGKLSGEEKSKYMETYRKNLDELGKAIAALRDAITAGNNDAAKVEIDKIGQLKNSSHKALGVQGGGGGSARGGPRGQGGRGPGGPPPAASPQPSAPQ